MGKKISIIVLIICVIFSNSIKGISIYAATDNSILNGNNTIVEEKKFTYENETYKLVFDVTNEWNEGYSVTVKIINISTEPINNWNLAINWQEKIENIWNATIESYKNNIYVISNCEYNRNVEVGGVIEFGFICVGDFQGFPQNCSLIENITEVVTSNYYVDFNILNEWEEGYTAGITIKNNRNTAIEDWELSFTFNGILTDIWNADLIEHNDDFYLIKNCGYNYKILPGESIYVGFNGLVIDGKEYDKIENVILSEKHIHSSDINNNEVNSNSTDNSVSLDNINFDAIDIAYNELEIIYNGQDSAICVTQDLNLINSINGVPIRWESDDNELVDNMGIVNRPYYDSKYVILTAHVGDSKKELVKNFKIKIVKSCNENKDYNDIKIIENIDDLLIYNAEQELFQVYLKETGKIDIMMGAISDLRIESPHEALLALHGIEKLIGINSDNIKLNFDKLYYDDDFVTYSFSQYYNDIFIEGAFLTLVTDLKGNAIALKNGLCEFDDRINLNEAIPIEDAIDIVSSTNEKIKDVYNLGKIIIYDNKPVVVWKLVYVLNNDIKIIYVDIQTGQIKKFKSDNLYSATENSKICSELAKDELGLDRKIIYLRTANKKKITDQINKINVFNEVSADSAESFNGDPNDVYEIMISENNWEPSVVSAYANIRLIQDYYKDNWNIDSIVHNHLDKEKLELLNKKEINEALKQDGFLSIYVNVESDYFSDYNTNAAYSSERNAIIFGNETDKSSREISMANSISIVAHEYTHGIIDLLCPYLTVNEYENETGAINEGYADVMGMLISNSPDWTITTELGNVIRNCKACTNYMELGTTKEIEKYNPYVAHENSKILSVACYNMLKNGIRRELLDKIIKQSLLLGYSSNATFNDVRNNILVAVSIYTNKDTLINAEKAFDEVGVKENRDLSLRVKEGRSLLNGIVLAADESKNENDYSPLSKVFIKIESEDGNFYCDNIVTNIQGKYSYKYLGTEDDNNKILPKGKYKLTFSHEDYQSVIMYIIINDDNVAYLEKVIMTPIESSINGLIRGRVIDASNGKGIEGLSITIRKGLYDFRGENVTQTKTKEEGYYTTSKLKAGAYTIYIEDKRLNISDEDRFLSLYKAFTLDKDLIEKGLYVAVTKPLKKEQVRIVLEWGTVPRDLDAHIKGYTLLNNGTFEEDFEIFYNNRTYGIVDYENDIELDRDDTDGYGPETITIYDALEDKYIFYVDNYSSDLELKYSKAIVRVYFDNYQENAGRPEYTFTVPTDNNGKYWIVFEYYPNQNKKISPINYISNYLPIG